MDRFDGLRERLRGFVAERDWAQFHTPKDLALSVGVETGELLETFQWRAPTREAVRQDAALMARVRDESADVLLYLMLLADACGFDLLEAAGEKLERNRDRYPVDRARGSSAKHTDL